MLKNTTQFRARKEALSIQEVIWRQAGTSVHAGAQGHQGGDHNFILLTSGTQTFTIHFCPHSASAALVATLQVVVVGVEGNLCATYR
jgi:ribosomal protein L27